MVGGFQRAWREGGGDQSKAERKVSAINARRAAG